MNRRPTASERRIAEAERALAEALEELRRSRILAAGAFTLVWYHLLETRALEARLWQ